MLVEKWRKVFKETDYTNNCDYDICKADKGLNFLFAMSQIAMNKIIIFFCKY